MRILAAKLRTLFFLFVMRSSSAHDVCSQADAEDPQCWWGWVSQIKFLSGLIVYMFIITSICRLINIITCCVFLLFQTSEEKRRVLIFISLRSDLKPHADPRSVIALIPSLINELVSHVISSFNHSLTAWNQINCGLLVFVAFKRFKFFFLQSSFGCSH